MGEETGELICAYNVGSSMFRIEIDEQNFPENTQPTKQESARYAYLTIGNSRDSIVCFRGNFIHPFSCRTYD